MKQLIYLVPLLLFVACDFTAVTQTVCGNSRDNIRGFEGRYQWDWGEGQMIPVSIQRTARGEYTLVSSDGAPVMTYSTCRINGVNIAESLVQSDDGSGDFLSLFKVTLSRRRTVISTLQFEEKSLNDNGVNYELEETEIEGIPLSVIQIDNSQLSSRDLVNLSVSSNGKEPFYIELIK